MLINHSVYPDKSAFPKNISSYWLPDTELNPILKLELYTPVKYCLLLYNSIEVPSLSNEENPVTIELQLCALEIHAKVKKNNIKNVLGIL